VESSKTFVENVQVVLLFIKENVFYLTTVLMVVVLNKLRRVNLSNFHRTIFILQLTMLAILANRSVSFVMLLLLTQITVSLAKHHI